MCCMYACMYVCNMRTYIMCMFVGGWVCMCACMYVHMHRHLCTYTQPNEAEVEIT